MKPWILTTTCITALVIGVFIGRYTPPIHQLLKSKQEQPLSRYTFDDKGKLIADEEKLVVPCPVQTDKTAVLLLLGQSNAANHTGQRYKSNYGTKIVNYYNNQCVIAMSPLLGSSGMYGEIWTQLGNLLIQSGRYDQIVLIPVAYSGSEILRWTTGGDLNVVLVNTLEKVRRTGLQITGVIWVQGEFDYVIRTTESDYRTRFMNIITTLHQYLTAPVYIAVASQCGEPSNGGDRRHIADNPIVRAQRALPDGKTIFEGVNYDRLLQPEDRFDDCHIGGGGSQKIAEAWAIILTQ